MCGRFTLRAPADQWCQLFLPDFDAEDLPWQETPRYNIAPTQSIVCVYRASTGQPRRPMKVRWGLLPPWAKELAIGNRMINARGESVDSKPSFRRAFASRRCLIPADGYYEWQKTEDGKQPYLMEPHGGGLLALAGLWEENTNLAEEGHPIRSCTIITTEANQQTRHLHDRMPVLIEPEDFDRWLDPGFRDTASLKELIRPAAPDKLQITAVSRRVNSPRHDDPKCVEPIASK